MAVGHTEISFFTFIDPGHPFYLPIQRCRSFLRESPHFWTIVERMEGGEKTAIHAEIKALIVPDHRWELDRFYWSFQEWDESRPLRFHGWTLYWREKTGQLELYQFPHDPYLTAMASLSNGTFLWHNGHGSASQVEVLRYVPLRRLTFRILDGERTGLQVIGKFKRRSTFKMAYNTLVAVSRAVKGAGAPFSVPTPLEINEEHCFFLQEAMRGQELSSLLDWNNMNTLLYQLGEIHHALHCLNISDVPEWDFRAFLEDLQRNIEWILFFRPEQQPFLHKVRDLLLMQLPGINPREYAFCHGDLVCSQILKDGDTWSLVDFDGAMRGDPHREIAMCIASFAYDLPLCEKQIIDSNGTETPLLEEGIDAYVNGYQEKRGRALNRKRLLWYRICSEIYYLALRFKKDRFHPILFDHTIRLLHHLSEQFQTEKGGNW